MEGLPDGELPDLAPDEPKANSALYHNRSRKFGPKPPDLATPCYGVVFFGSWGETARVPGTRCIDFVLHVAAVLMQSRWR